MSKLVDYAPGTGVYEGDLRYGRANGHIAEKHKDFDANRIDGKATNSPVVPLTLVQPRDPQVWVRDPKLKEARKQVSESQHVTNHIIEMYKSWGDHLKSNIRLTVGKQKM